MLLGMRMVLWIAYCSVGPYVLEHASPSGDHVPPSGANTDPKGVKNKLALFVYKVQIYIVKYVNRYIIYCGIKILWVGHSY